MVRGDATRRRIHRPLRRHGPFRAPTGQPYRIRHKLPSRAAGHLSSSSGPRAGCLIGGDVLDAWELLGEPERAGLRELIAEERLADIGSALAEGTPEGSEPIADPELL